MRFLNVRIQTQILVFKCLSIVGHLFYIKLYLTWILLRILFTTYSKDVNSKMDFPISYIFTSFFTFQYCFLSNFPFARSTAIHTRRFQILPFIRMTSKVERWSTNRNHDNDTRDHYPSYSGLVRHGASHVDSTWKYYIFLVRKYLRLLLTLGTKWLSVSPHWTLFYFFFKLCILNNPRGSGRNCIFGKRSLIIRTRHESYLFYKLLRESPTREHFPKTLVPAPQFPYYVTD